MDDLLNELLNPVSFPVYCNNYYAKKLQSASYIVGTFIRSRAPCGIPSLG